MVIDRGHGDVVVLVPGIQGRWEWMAPTVECLAQRHRVLSYSLADEPSSGCACDPGDGFASYVRQLEQVLDEAHVHTATIVGVSYGGLIASEFAARHPERVSRLVLASALPTDWTPDARARFYLRAPRLLSPVFVATSPLRLQPEVRAAFPHLTSRLRFMARHGARVLRAPTSPVRMARRVRWAEAYHFAAPAAIAAPTLVLTGEPGLDRVVPVDQTVRCLHHLKQARHVVLPRTGHLGVVTKPEAFCGAIDDFLDDCDGDSCAPARPASISA